jgi:hypothetical protein
MHKIKLILLLILPISVFAQDLGIIDTRTTKNPALNGTYRISTDGKNLFFRNFFGISEKVANTDSATFTGLITLPSTTSIGNVSSTELSYLDGVTSSIQTQLGNKQPQLNGTGFVKASGTTISYDNSTYLTTSSASSTYLPLAGGTITGSLTLNNGAKFVGQVGTLYNGNQVYVDFLGTSYGRIQSYNAVGSFGMPLVLQGSGSNVGIGIVPTTRKLEVSDVIRSIGGGFEAITPFSSGSSYRLILNTTDDKFYLQNSTDKFVSNFSTRLLVDNSGNVGIGTTSPSEKLNVTGNILASGTVLGSNLSGTNTGDNATNTQYSGLATSKQDALNGTGFVKASGTTISYDNSTYLTTSTASSTYLPIANPTATGTLTAPTISNTLGANFATSSGNVGIGTASPVSKLDIQGTTATDTAPLGTELLTASNWTSTGWTGSFATGWVHTTGNTTVLSNTLAASNATYYQIAYTVTGRTVGTFDINFGGVNTTGLSTTGAIGILSTSTGTLSITPTSTFDGTIVISIKTIGTSTALVTYKNSSGAIINEIRNTTSNTFYGVNSGRRITTGTGNTAIGQGSLAVNTTGSTNSAVGVNTLNSNTTGNNNTAVGYLSLQVNTTGNNNSAFGASLTGNTTGASNSAFGYNSSVSNTTGSSNSAFGVSSLLSNTTGIQNSSFGANSSINNTTGNYNSAFGFTSLSNNTSGNYNVALGLNAGRYINGGSVANTITNNSIYIGIDTKALADNQTNQIVIGYGAVGNGSNTTVLGNTSTTQTQIFGNTILSNTAQAVDAGYKLDVTGTSRFTSKMIINSAFNSGLSLLNGSSNGQIYNDGNLHLEAAEYLWINGNSTSLTQINAGGGNTYINSGGGRVGIGTISPVASAVLDITSTTQGVLFPRLTTAQINAIASPANGLTVYNTTLATLCFYDGTGWKRVVHLAM